MVHHIGKPIGARSLYFKLALKFKTPFIYMLDKRYRPLPTHMISSLYGQVDFQYEADFRDCDDFAWFFKALAIQRKLNGVGFVLGNTKWGFHAWNVVLTEVGVLQLEPQNGKVFEKDKRYRPWVVII